MTMAFYKKFILLHMPYKMCKNKPYLSKCEIISVIIYKKNKIMIDFLEISDILNVYSFVKKKLRKVW